MAMQCVHACVLALVRLARVASQDQLARVPASHVLLCMCIACAHSPATPMRTTCTRALASAHAGRAVGMGMGQLKR